MYSTLVNGRASVMVIPNSSQFFEYENILVSCNSSSSWEWTPWRNDTTLVKCGSGWGKLNVSTCNITTVKLSEGGVFWCQSKYGDSSNGVNISIVGGPVSLQSPAVPVTEGDNVTLTCRTKMADAPSADFYKDGVSIGAEDDGHMTLYNFTKSNQGAYKCRVQHTGESPESWVTMEDLEAKPGEDVTLPCNSPTAANVTKLVWKRPELEDDNVFFFRNKRADENYQDPRYRGRVELKDPEMKNGDVSVVLKEVTVSDTGTYQCRVTTSNMPTELLHSVHLVVSEGESVFLLKSSSIGLKMMLMLCDRSHEGRIEETSEGTIGGNLRTKKFVGWFGRAFCHSRCCCWFCSGICLASKAFPPEGSSAEASEWYFVEFRVQMSVLLKKCVKHSSSTLLCTPTVLHQLLLN
ncbi:neural cell adhesion molecule 2-like isoform X2 [Pseudochaenichthys georgianus]|uniref:neural cell adhesion molecule 2-like isoform X2 n=1 Tax=Pseudochaenichthys georgianus TaxID=52239 RepID=UPI00146DF178|nr:uncharacterized protein LOC117463656 isoform X2 [Pseudochaenichthys georgianus]